MTAEVGLSALIVMSVPAVTLLAASTLTLPPDVTLSVVPAPMVEVSTFTPAPTSFVVIEMPLFMVTEGVVTVALNAPFEFVVIERPRPPSPSSDRSRPWYRLS